ncbi:IclR family transcriptional regulator [Andreprevotia chitinilytica]|uniref:IclR family transcriptional regulator n=1 Tax=Andreprevotia chitinilytica TaxID=396808 RepID=UPI0005585A6A|nr:IclR family transcriptional regulator [Andreprevotia chitinilytica]
MTLKTLDGALDLLGFFSAKRPIWGVRELAKESEVHYSVVHRVLATFAAHGVLLQNPTTSKYSLGLRLYELGQLVHKTISPNDVVQPMLEALARESGETVFLSWLDGLEGLCLDMVHSQYPLRFSIEPGERFALHAGSHAKAMLAFQSESFRNVVYDRGVAGFPELSPLDRAAIEASLGLIREAGWAYTENETASHVAGLAVPLRTRDRQVIGAVAIAGPDERLNRTAIPKLLAPLLLARDQLERVIGLLR